MRRLYNVGKFAVAVIDHHVCGGIHLFDSLDYLAYLLHGQSLSLRISAGALYHHRGDIFIRRCSLYRENIRIAVGVQIDLCVIYAVEFERTVAVAADADGASERIVRHTGDGENCIARLHQREHRRGQRMSAVDKADAHKRGFRTEYLGVDLIQRFAAEIVIAVASRSGKAGVGNAVILKRRHYAAGILLGNSVYLRKSFSQLGLNALRHSKNFGFYICNFHLF